MELIELRCKSCGAVLKPESVNLALAMARCEHCGALFGLRNAPGLADVPITASVVRQKVPMPKGFDVVIEQELERHLGIEDRPVRGELPR